jgi:hypothetical protein
MLMKFRIPRHTTKRYPAQKPSHAVAQYRWKDHQHKGLEHSISGQLNRLLVYQPRPALGSQEGFGVVMSGIWQGDPIDTGAIEWSAGERELPGHCLFFRIACRGTATMLSRPAREGASAVDVPHPCSTSWAAITLNSQTTYSVTKIRTITERSCATAV